MYNTSHNVAEKPRDATVNFDPYVNHTVDIIVVVYAR